MTGTGTLDLSIPYIRTELKGDWSKFTGRVNVTTTNATEGEFRINNLFDMPMAAINLGNKVNANHLIPVPPEGLGFSIGEVAGVAGSFLKGAPTINAGRIFTYTVEEKTPTPLLPASSPSKPLEPPPPSARPAHGRFPARTPTLTARNLLLG